MVFKPSFLNVAKGFVIVLLLAAVGCEPRPISELSPDDGIQRIREDHSSRRWEQVVQEVGEYRSRYPYSQFASEAELLLADAHYNSEKYPEAIAVYEDFIKRNPTHPKREIAVYRIARSYDNQSSEAIDREQDFTRKAIGKYSEYQENFPKSDRSTEVAQRLHELMRRVAENEQFVARFYWKKDLWQGALSRYLNILKEYPQYQDLRKEALERAAICYNELAKMLEADPKSDAVVYFKGTTPSELRRKAKELNEKKS